MALQIVLEVLLWLAALAGRYLPLCCKKCSKSNSDKPNERIATEALGAAVGLWINMVQVAEGGGRVLQSKLG